MRVSIWQQFSSNHSGAFTLIGRFPTPEAAQKALDELREMLITVDNWRWKSSEAENWHNVELRPSKSWWYPSPPEESYASLFGVPQDQWFSLLEWLPKQDAHQFTNILNVEGCDVLIHDDGIPTWSHGNPFVRILAGMGAEVYGSIEDTPMDFTLIFQIAVPNAETADVISAALLDEDRPAAWLHYVDGKSPQENQPLYEAAQEIVKLRRHYRSTSDVWHVIHKKKLYDTYQLTEGIKMLRSSLKVSRQENTLLLRNVIFFNITKALPAFLEWLRAMKCTVTYQVIGIYDP